MPINESSYKPRLFFKSGHIQTIYPALFRRPPGIIFSRERINTPDGDFLDLDWIKNSSKKLVILSHGMEGSTSSQYILGMSAAFSAVGWDCLAWNFRGCSGTPNLKLRFYHSGASEDLTTVINHAISFGQYEEISLIGFSMGGNITLKYAGENAENIPALIKKVVTFGVPCDLRSCVVALAKKRNIVYMKRFLRDLKVKMQEKSERFPDAVSMKGYNKIKDFFVFDRIYTAPMNGFQSEEHYWTSCASRQFIPSIRIPTLLVNPKNDPFLGDGCYPYEEAKANDYFFLETPKYGGHIGFIEFNKLGQYWSEKRALKFLSQKD